MKLGSTSVNLSSVSNVLHDIDQQAESTTESRITLIASSALSAANGNERAKALQDRLTQQGYSQFAVQFNRSANKIEIIDGKELEADLEQWAGSDAKRAMAAQKIKEAFYSNASNLTLPHLGLTSLPNSIGLLASLRQLSLGNNRLQTLPDSIGDLVDLEQLHLGNNRLEMVSDSIGLLVKLRELSLGNNRLQTLPDSICNLSELEDLSLDNNQLQTLPNLMGRLTSLETFSASHNHLETIPNSIGDLGNLTELQLSHNKLQTVPETLGNLASLEQLHLGNNQLPTVPDSIGDLGNLTDLHLSNNKLQVVPVSIGRLTSLQRLSLNNNQMETLPASIGLLVNLIDLHLSNNKLRMLPDSLASLVNLKELILTNNQLEALPDSTRYLANLTQLLLDNNKLQIFPNPISSLTSLKNLSLNNNELETLPDSIRDLVNLETLTLTHNLMRALPEQVRYLVNLHTLYLNRNRLQTLPDSMGYLINLRILRLENNPQLNALPLALGQCRELTFIDCGHTAIAPGLYQSIMAVCQARREAESVQVLPHRITAWEAAAGETFSAAVEKEGKEEKVPLKDFIAAMPLDAQQIIAEWLTRLERTKDFSTNCQKDLAQTTCSMLRSLSDNAAFKIDFFAQVPVNNVECGDRAGMAFNELYLTWRLATLPSHTPEKDKFDLMIRAAKTMALRAALENQISQHERETKHEEAESVQISLYYEIALTKPLNLLTAIKEMLYPHVGQRDWIDQNALIQDVKKTTLDHLSRFPLIHKMVDDVEAWKQELEKFGEQQFSLIEQREGETINEGVYLAQSKSLKIEQERAKQRFARTWVENKLKTIEPSSPSPSSSSSTARHGKDEARES